ncbi:MAG TPA: hypothetical protein VFJ16_28700 [Longimicrobium sp.]|nr:hypothetical protein [Longimicrobium sp.]
MRRFTAVSPGLADGTGSIRASCTMGSAYSRSCVRLILPGSKRSPGCQARRRVTSRSRSGGSGATCVAPKTATGPGTTSSTTSAVRAAGFCVAEASTVAKAWPRSAAAVASTRSDCSSRAMAYRVPACSGSAGVRTAGWIVSNPRTVTERTRTGSPSATLKRTATPPPAGRTSLLVRASGNPQAR